jgi:hypothetical protein
MVYGLAATGRWPPRERETHHGKWSSDHCGKSGDITTPVHDVWRDDGDGTERERIGRESTMSWSRASLSLSSSFSFYKSIVRVDLLYRLIFMLFGLCVCVFVRVFSPSLSICSRPWVLLMIDAHPSSIPLPTEFIHFRILHPSRSESRSPIDMASGYQGFFCVMKCHMYTESTFLIQSWMSLEKYSKGLLFIVIGQLWSP